MKSLAKILKPAKILFPLIFGALLLSNPAKAQKISFLKEFDLGIVFHIDNTKLENIPLEIRDVPKHPDDYFVPDINVAPIDDEKMKIGMGAGDLSLKFGGKLSLFKENVQIKTGAGIGIGEGGGSDKSRNYTNYPGTSKRGYGAALTFYEVRKRYVIGKYGWVRPFLFSELNTELSRILNISFNEDNKYINKIGIGAGYEIFKEKIIAENGWDRYNHFETWKKYNLCDLVIGRPYLFINLLGDKVGDKEDNNFKSNLDFKSNLKLTGGFDYILKKKETNIGKETKINYNPGWFAGISASMEF